MSAERQANADRHFIVMKASDRKLFGRQEDRDYFAKPVEVKLSHSCVYNRQLYVTDPVRGHTYPVASAKSLLTYYQLTKKQREGIRSYAPV